MIQITITRRIKNTPCGKCGNTFQEGQKAMVARNQSGKRLCLTCWENSGY